MPVRSSSEQIFCPQCGVQGAPGADVCSACGAALPEPEGAAHTVHAPALENDPEVVDLWHQLRHATLGEYDIYAPIGRGGMATVFLGLDLALERQVAIKVISPAMLRTASLVERFKREARTAASLSHPNIIPVHQVKEVDGLVFFVMKYVDGRSLESIIREEGPLSLDVTASILTQVGGALHFAHRKGVVHRDVKPANIMIDQDGWAIVTDFGIAKVADAVGVTSAGMIVGTPAYMSPEQFSSATVTGAADQYSLGIVAFEMLTGRTPFSALSIADMMRAHMMDPPETPKALRPDLPEWLAKVILRMLCKEPELRWATIGDAVDALEPLSRSREEDARSAMITLAKSGSNERPRISVPMSPIPLRRSAIGRSATRPPAPPSPAAPVSSGRAWLVGGAVAALLLATGFGTALWLRSRDKPLPSPEVGFVAGAPAPVKGDSVATRTPAQASPQAAGVPKAAERPADKAAVKTADKAGDNAADKTQNPQNAKRVAAEQGKTQSVGAAKSSKSAKDAAGQATAPAPATAKSEPVASSELPKIAVVPPADSAKAVVTPPAPAPEVAPPPKPVPKEGVVRIGSRTQGAFLYINGTVQGALSGLRNFTLPTGPVRLGIRADGCDAWGDSTVVIPPGETALVGFRNLLNCKP